jgi:hypothetical protein
MPVTAGSERPVGDAAEGEAGVADRELLPVDAHATRPYGGALERPTSRVSQWTRRDSARGHERGSGTLSSSEIATGFL